MNLLDIYRQRRSVRAFDYRPIPESDWADILEAGRIAATSRNKQARRFVVFNEPERIQQVAVDAKMQEFVKDASALVVACTTDKQTIGIDAIISLAQMEAMAVSKGIGTIWLGIFDRDIMASMIDLPEDYKIVVTMAFGYAAVPGEMPEKLATEQLFCTNSLANLQ